VVVDNENTSQLLIQNGNLARRTTFIPLTKIRPWVMDAKIIRTAQNLVMYIFDFGIKRRKKMSFSPN
jgi:Chromosome segregation ATPases